MTVTYCYDPGLDTTYISDPANSFFHAYPGQMPHKVIHDKYDILVFEIIKPNPIVQIDEQKDESDILDT